MRLLRFFQLTASRPVGARNDIRRWFQYNHYKMLFKQHFPFTDKVTMADYIDEFINYITAVRNLSGETIRSYRSDLRQFRDFLARDFSSSDLIGVNTLILRSYLLFLKKQQ